MKKIAIMAVLLLSFAAVITAGCVTLEEPEEIDYATAIIGDWKSVGEYQDGETVFTMIYHFDKDGYGTLDKVVDDKVVKTVNIGWQQYKDNIYAIGYIEMGAIDYLYMSEDGKVLMNEDNQYFAKL